MLYVSSFKPHNNQSPTMTTMTAVARTVNSLFNDGRIKAQSGDVIGSEHTACKLFPWWVAVTGRTWPFLLSPFPVDCGSPGRGVGLGPPCAQPWAPQLTSLPWPGLFPSRSHSQAPHRLLGSALQEADPTV